MPNPNRKLEELLNDLFELYKSGLATPGRLALLERLINELQASLKESELTSETPQPAPYLSTSPLRAFVAPQPP